MVLPVFATFEHIEADLSSIGGPEIHARESLGGTSVYADVAFAAGLIQRLPRFQGGIG